MTSNFFKSINLDNDLQNGTYYATLKHYEFVESKLVHNSDPDDPQFEAYTKPYVLFILNVEGTEIKTRLYGRYIYRASFAIRKQLGMQFEKNLTVDDVLIAAMHNKFRIKVSHDVRYGLQIDYPDESEVI